MAIRKKVDPQRTDTESDERLGSQASKMIEDDGVLGYWPQAPRVVNFDLERKAPL